MYVTRLPLTLNNPGMSKKNDHFKYVCEPYCVCSYAFQNMLDEASSTVAADNIQLAVAIIVKSASEKGLLDIDKRLSGEVEVSVHLFTVYYSMYSYAIVLANSRNMVFHPVDGTSQWPPRVRSSTPKRHGSLTHCRKPCVCLHKLPRRVPPDRRRRMFKILPTVFTNSSVLTLALSNQPPLTSLRWQGK
jgi:hypothetical protein